MGPLVTYSPKVFIPLTTLCRDVCGYCTFARPPRRGERAYLPVDEVLAIARAGAAAGCTEALFTLGDKPELRYRVAREELAALGFATTIEYLAHCAGRVLDETGLLPHLNPGVMSRAELELLRPVSASMGIMLETVADRLAERAGPTGPRPTSCPPCGSRRSGSPGELAIPFTSGILIGIGETRAERIEALLALKALGDEYGHLGEVIVQNFRAKPGTRMADHPDATLEDQLWTVAVARILLGAGPARAGAAEPRLRRLPAAPRRRHRRLGRRLARHDRPRQSRGAVARDRALRARRPRRVGSTLAPRLPLYPEHVADLDRWVDAAVAPAVRRASDALGLAREDRWAPGRAGRGAVPRPARRDPARADGDELGRRRDRAAVLGARRGARARARRGRPAAARGLRRRGDLRRDPEHPVHERLLLQVRLLRVLERQARREPARPGVPRADGRDRAALGRGVGAGRDRGVPSGRDPPRRSRATTTRRSSPRSAPRCRASTSTRSPRSRCGRARRRSASRSTTTSRGCATSGSARCPGTAAEILDDEMRAIICPDKVSTDQWLEVHDAAHRVGLRSNVTMMMGHVERPRALGQPSPPGARAAGAERRLHRVRAAAVRADGGADLPQGARPPRADLRRGAARSRRGAARAPSADHEHPGVVGQARARRASGRRSPRASTTSAGR